MRSTVVLCAVLCVLVLAGVASAEVPGVMSYQGVLEDSVGVRVPDGSYDMLFRLYSASTGGTPMWSEDQSVYVTDGVFDVILGSVNPLSWGFGQQLWLGIAVEYDPELYPRTQLTSAPYAFRAAVAESLSGYVPSGDSDWLFNGTGDIYRITGNVGIGETQPDARLEIVAPSGETGILATASDSINTAGRFVAEGNGTALVANSQGTGSALYALATGTGYAAQFVGSGGVRIDGECNMNAFRMYPYSEAGYVLTSDTNGVGTWQAPTGGGEADNDWTVTGDDMYSQVTGNVGIGVGTPAAKLDVGSDDGIAARIASSSISPGPALEVSSSNGQAAEFSPPNPPLDPDYSIATVHALAESGVHAGWFTAFDDGNAVVAFSWDNDALVAHSRGNSGIYATSASSMAPAIAGHALGTGHSGYFFGGAGARVDDGLEVNGGLDVTGGGGVAVYAESEGSSPAVEASALGTGRAGYFTGVGDEVLRAEYTGPVEVGAVGVYGKSQPDDNCGIGGWFEGGWKGIYARTVNYSDENAFAIYGYAVGGTDRRYGVYGEALGGDYATGVYGIATEGTYASYAGQFVGDVSVLGTLSKSAGSFKIDHPLDPANKYLSHSFVESPDMMNVYNGNTVMDRAGEARVELPEWFDVLNRDFRYQLTCIGGFAPVYIAEKITGNSFKIAGGEPGMEVSWQVTGIRQDRYAEEHPIVVEEDKVGADAGKYLHPDLYGLPRSEGVGFVEGIEGGER